MDKQKLIEKFGKSSFIELYKPFYYIFSLVIWICLGVSAYLSYFTYLERFAEFPMHHYLAIAVTVFISLVIGYCSKHVFTLWYSDNGGWDFIGVLLIGAITFNIWTDFSGSEIKADLYHEKPTNGTTRLDDIYSTTMSDYKNRLLEQNKTLETNKNWAKKAYSKDKKTSNQGWVMYNKFTKAKTLKEEIQRNKDAYIKSYSSQRATEVELFNQEVNKRNKKILDTSNSLKGVSTLCMIAVVLLTNWTFKYERRVLDSYKNQRSTPIGNKAQPIGFGADATNVISLQQRFPITAENLRNGMSLRAAVKESGEPITHLEVWQLSHELK